jgi:hypothetical protein
MNKKIKVLKDCEEKTDCRSCEHYKKPFAECRAIVIAQALCDAGFVNGSKKILFVEDGSVDIGDLKDEVYGLNVSIVTYRQGSEKPYVVEVGKA